MFSYYGSKSKLVNYYPKPDYPLIIEPFAGSARYSIKYCDIQVWVNDLYTVLYDIWVYLTTATPSQIKSIPELERGDDVRCLDIPEIEKNLLGFMVNRGVSYPRHILTKWPSESNEIAKVKQRILNYLPKIRHWYVTNLSYNQLPNIDATWFIDPPYQVGGDRYMENQIDYDDLADWCKSRKGQIIVCENDGGTWLPFRPLKQLHGQKRTTQEVIWTNY